jgi:hypothetical protein
MNKLDITLKAYSVLNTEVAALREQLTNERSRREVAEAVNLAIHTLADCGHQKRFQTMQVRQHDAALTECVMCERNAALTEVERLRELCVDVREAWESGNLCRIPSRREECDDCGTLMDRLRAAAEEGK